MAFAIPLKASDADAVVPLDAGSGLTGVRQPGAP
jgi:hypothetical protein